MDTQSRGIGCKSLLLVVVLALLMGALAGGAAGGALGYVVAQQSTAAAAVVTQPASASVPTTQVISLKTDNAIVDAVKKVRPTVVTVVNTLQPQRVPSIFGQPRTRQGQAMGTGVIIDQQGHIITNDHVIADAQKIEVVFDNGDKADATLVGTDAFSDLAILQVTGKQMPAVAELGDSAALQVGEPVIAIGSALGDLKDTVTVGVVSGLNRQMQANNSSYVDGLIQTDAAINHGNSGGPLLNARGQVIGINELVVTSSANGDVAQGLGFAIPVNTVKQVSAQLIQGGKVSRPFLGVSYQMLTPQLAAANNVVINHGAWIQEVTSGSPAARAGLKVGDIITAVDGKPLDETTDLVTALAAHKVGDSIALTIQRGTQSLTMNATLVERPSTTS